MRTEMSALVFKYITVYLAGFPYVENRLVPLNELKGSNISDAYRFTVI